MKRTPATLRTPTPTPTLAMPRLNVLLAVLLVLVAAAIRYADFADVGQDDAELGVDGDADDGVPHLTPESYQKHKDDGRPALVYFYASWCKHCKATGPVYAVVARSLQGRKDIRVRVAKVDAEKYMSLAESEAIGGFPTIRLLWDGQSAEFNGERTVPNIIRWVERKLGEGVQEMKALGEVRTLLSSAPVAVVGFFKDAQSEVARMFRDVSRVVDSFPFGMVVDEELFDEFDAEDGTVSVFKTFDDGRRDWHTAPTAASLQRFVEESARPLVPDFRAVDAAELFGNAQNANKSLVVLFLSKKNGHYEKLLDSVRSVAYDYRSKFSFVTVNGDTEDSKIVFDAFELNRTTATPAMRAFSFETLDKYAPNSKMLNGPTVRAFVRSIMAGEIKPYMASEELPADWDQGHIKVLVRSNFEQVAFDGRRHALVLFHTEGCQHCVALKPIFNRVAKQFEDERSLTIAQINVQKNVVSDLADVDIPGVPVIVLYPKCSKRPIVFEGERKFENIVNFVRDNIALSMEDESEEDPDGEAEKKSKRKGFSADKEEL